MAALCLVQHEKGSGGILFHFGSCLAANPADRFVSIVYHQFFSEGIDKVLGASRYYELVRIKGGETDCVADLVTP